MAIVVLFALFLVGGFLIFKAAMAASSSATHGVKKMSDVLGSKKKVKKEDAFAFGRKGGATLVGRGWSMTEDDSERAGGTELYFEWPAHGIRRKISGDLRVRDAFFGAADDIAYIVDDAFSVYQYRLSDEKTTKIAEKALMPTLSPDGGALVYQKLGHEWLPGHPYDDALGITVLDLNTGIETSITQRWEDYLPFWTPDSASIIFFRPDDAGALVPMIRRMSASDAMRIDAPEYLPVPSERPEWSADHKTLAYESDRKIIVAEFGEDFHHIKKIRGAGNGIEPSWSTDGELRFEPRTSEK